MKYIFYPIIVAAVIVSIYIYILVIISRFYFKFDLSGISLAQLSGTGKINVKINGSVQNDNDFRVTFSDLYVQLFYNKELIATSQKVDDKKYTIPAKGKFQFEETVDLYVNPTTLQLAANIALKVPTEIEYQVRLKIFGIKIPTIIDKFTI